MRTLVRLLALILIAIGAGLLVYGTTVDPAQFRAPLNFAWLLSPTETVAMGTGFLVGGLLLLAMFGIRQAQSDPFGKS